MLRRLLEQVASGPDRYYFAPDGEDLAGIYREIAGRLIERPAPQPPGFSPLRNSWSR